MFIAASFKIGLMWNNIRSTNAWMDTENMIYTYNGLLLFSRSVVSDSFGTLWTVACQAPLSTGFPRQEYWSALPFLSPGESSWPRYPIHVSCISCPGRWSLVHWATENPSMGYCACCHLSRVWLFNPMDCILPVHSLSVMSSCLWPHRLGLTRLFCPWHSSAKILEWVVISFSRESSLPRDWTCISYV